MKTKEIVRHSIVFLGLVLVFSWLSIHWYLKKSSQEQEQVEGILKDLEVSSDLIHDDQNSGSSLGAEVTDTAKEAWEKIETSVSVSDIPQEQERDQAVSEESFTLPEKFNLPVQFHSQSPLGTWWEIFWETCEEASVLLAFLYFQGKTLSPQEFQQELLNIVSYQNTVFWDFVHTTVAQTAQILRDFYRYDNYQILENPSANDIKQHIAQGKIVLAPFYGVGLNPYYSDGWPEYHFMLIKWYTQDYFITHDVGTKRWADYKYPVDVLMERLHDYNPEDIRLWKKRILVVWGESE